MSERDIRGVDRPQVLQWLRDDPQANLLVDARARSRFQAGRLPGAINLGIAQIDLQAEARRPDLDSRERLIVYGQNPGDTLATGLTLRLLEAGYTQAVLFRGGVDEWTTAGGQLETSAPGESP